MPLPPIVYEDDVLIAFDKPGGLSVAPGRQGGTGENLMELVHAKFGRSVARAHLPDADMSGLVLCAKTKSALDFVSGQFQAKTVERKYHALVTGSPAPDTFAVDRTPGDGPPATGRRRGQKKGGQPGVTEFRVLERFGRWALLECRPLTGRPHQIRVHLQEAGHPVLNDPLYGDGSTLLLSQLKHGYKGRDDERPLIARLALHASELTLKHPVTHAPVTLQAPWPHDFAVALKYLRKFAARR